MLNSNHKPNRSPSPSTLWLFSASISFSFSTLWHIQLVHLAIISSIWESELQYNRRLCTVFVPGADFSLSFLSGKSCLPACLPFYLPYGWSSAKFTLNLKYTKRIPRPKVCVHSCWQLAATHPQSHHIRRHWIRYAPTSLACLPAPASCDSTFMLNCIFLQRPQTTAIAARQMGFMNAHSNTAPAPAQALDPDLDRELSFSWCQGEL